MTAAHFDWCINSYWFINFPNILFPRYFLDESFVYYWPQLYPQKIILWSRRPFLKSKSSCLKVRERWIIVIKQIYLNTVAKRKVVQNGVQNIYVYWILQECNRRKGYHLTNKRHFYFHMTMWSLSKQDMMKH